MLEDPLELSLTCRLFQIYFYFVFPDKDSKLHNQIELTKEALDTLLNELFLLDQGNNERIIKKYMEQRQIQMT